jgi:hypothetical protein
VIWIAPSEKDKATDTLEKRLWDATDQLRANSSLKLQEYSGRNRAPSFPHFRVVITLAKQIQNFHRTRAMLLPRLRGGRLCELASSQ